MDDHGLEELRELFVSQKQFGDYKEEMAKTVQEIRGDWRAVKWLIGLVGTGILLELIATLAKLPH